MGKVAGADAVGIPVPPHSQDREVHIAQLDARGQWQGATMHAVEAVGIHEGGEAP